MKAVFFTPTGKANVDCAEAVRVGNAYAESLGFMVWDGCHGYFPPVYFEQDYSSSQWTQEKMNSVMKEMVDVTKDAIEDADGFTMENAPEGWVYTINCAAWWDASLGCHVMYVYY